MHLELDPDDIDLLRIVLRQAIEANRFPLSPEVKALEALLTKIEAQATQPAAAAKKKPHL